MAKSHLLWSLTNFESESKRVLMDANEKCPNVEYEALRRAKNLDPRALEYSTITRW